MNSTSSTIELTLEPQHDLWDLVANWISKSGKYNTAEIFNITATLLHVAASNWKAFIPPDDLAGVLTEEQFIRLARKMFRGRPNIEA